MVWEHFSVAKSLEGNRLGDHHYTKAAAGYRCLHRHQNHHSHGSVDSFPVKVTKWLSPVKMRVMNRCENKGSTDSWHMQQNHQQSFNQSIKRNYRSWVRICLFPGFIICPPPWRFPCMPFIISISLPVIISFSITSFVKYGVSKAWT